MIKLGDRVRDEVTGFEGVVLARAEALYEATLCRVHSRSVDDQGNPRVPVWFEEDRLTIIEDHAIIGFRCVVGSAEASEVQK